MILSRDGRATGSMVKQAALAGLTAVGCNVLDADIASTPTCGVLVSHMNAAAGLQITASHNPLEWNGLKPFTPRGSVFDANAGRELLEILENRQFGWQRWDKIGSIEQLTNASAIHQERVRVQYQFPINLSGSQP